MPLDPEGRGLSDPGKEKQRGRRGPGLLFSSLYSAACFPNIAPFLLIATQRKPSYLCQTGALGAAACLGDVSAYFWKAEFKNKCLMLLGAGLDVLGMAELS